MGLALYPQQQLICMVWWIFVGMFCLIPSRGEQLFCHKFAWFGGFFFDMAKCCYSTVRCIRPYHVENTSSRPITEVKQHRAALVLGWVPAWEYAVLYTFFHQPETC